MMDRNTITALLLITVVLIVTPYYIKLVSPDVDPIEETSDDFVETTQQPVVYREYENTLNQQDNNDLIIQGETIVENLVKVENDLYIATISSKNGGSIASFEIKDHLKSDSSFVNLSSNNNKNNLLISFKNFNGEPVNINSGWVQQFKGDNFYIDNSKTLIYTNNLGKGKITKALTFHPDRFVIDIDTDITEIATNTLGGNALLVIENGRLQSVIELRRDREVALLVQILDLTLMHHLITTQWRFEARVGFGGTRAGLLRTQSSEDTSLSVHSN